jgi:hypothetical protein
MNHLVQQNNMSESRLRLDSWIKLNAECTVTGRVGYAVRIIAGRPHQL